MKCFEEKKRGRPKTKWGRQVDGGNKKNGLEKERAINKKKWDDAVYEIARDMRAIRPPPLTITKPDLKGSLSLSLSLCY